MKDNVARLRLAHALENHSKKSKQHIWRSVSEKIEGPRQNRSLVNVGEIARNSKDGSTVIVAGKVLGGGSLDHKVNVAAYSFSESAKSKISKSGGKCFSLGEFMGENKSVKDVIMLG
jgi:large subunit ribosomal protein L18e